MGLSSDKFVVAQLNGGCWSCVGPATAVKSNLGNDFLEANFEYFGGLLAKRLSGGLWEVIVNISEACWPEGSQETSGDSF